MTDDFDDDLIDDDIREETEREHGVSGAVESAKENASKKKKLTAEYVNGKAENTLDWCGDVGETLRSVEWLQLTLAFLYGLLIAPLVILTPIARAAPASWRVYHKINKWSAWQMEKAASADAIANVRKSNDKEDMLPAKLVESSNTDSKRSGWKVKGIDGKRYDPSVRGGDTSRYGKADMIHINEDDPEQGTWVETAMDAALQADRERYLFMDATIKDIKRGVPRDTSLNGGPAVADGGFEANSEMMFDVRQRDISIETPGVNVDMLVPLNSIPGFDGTVVSFNQYSTLKNQKTDQQAIQDAKDAGRMAALMEQLDKKDLFKWALVLGAAGAVLLFHQDIGAAIASFGGGGGGGGNVAPTGGLGLLAPLGRRLRGE